MRTRPSRRFSSGAFAEAARADQDLVARAHELGVPLGQLQAQDVVVLGERGDRLAGHHDAPVRDRNAKDAPGGGREHGAFARLLRDDAAVAAHRVELALGDVEAVLAASTCTCVLTPRRCNSSTRSKSVLAWSRCESWDSMRESSACI